MLGVMDRVGKALRESFKWVNLMNGFTWLWTMLGAWDR
jgi:hypothetical protein